MAHFARIEGDIVQEVIAIDNNDCGGGNFPESEKHGQDFIKSLGLDGEWIQVSYNGSFRHRFPSPGFIYDRLNDLFISSKPYSSWLLNNHFDWQAPIEYPDDGLMYKWDDAIQNWVPLDYLPPIIVESLQRR